MSQPSFKAGTKVAKDGRRDWATQLYYSELGNTEWDISLQVETTLKNSPHFQYALSFLITCGLRM